MVCLEVADAERCSLIAAAILTEGAGELLISIDCVFDASLVPETCSL
jgi:hypothetical protein